MPYHLRKNDDKSNPFCIFDDDGKNRGCSTSRKLAMGHMRALYANEKKKELDDPELDVLMKDALDEYEEAYLEEIPNRDVMLKLYISEGTFNRTRRAAIRSLARALGEMEASA